MGLLAWLRGLFGRGDAAVESPRRCVVCGTEVAPAATECPLCHGSDLVAVGEADPGASNPEASEPVTTSRGDATDDAVGRLREVRETREE